MKNAEKNIEKFPLDFDALDYGSVINNEVIEEVYDVKYEHRDFPMRQMNLGKMIEKEMELRGKPCVTRIKDGKLIILHHEETVDYTKKSFNRGIRGAIRSHAQALKIDITKLSDQTKLNLDDNIKLQSHIIAGIEGGRKLSYLEMKNNKEVSRKKLVKKD